MNSNPCVPRKKILEKLYELFKVHNDHVFPELPPERPIVSGCGSITENISKFLDHHAKDLVQDMDSYLQNTPDLSSDVVGLYLNISHYETIKTMTDALNTFMNQLIVVNYNLIQIIPFINLKN